MTAADAQTECNAMHTACGKEPKKRLFSGHGKWVKCNEKANDDCSKLSITEANAEAATTTASGVSAALSAPNATLSAPSNSNNTIIYLVIGIIVIGGIILLATSKKPNIPVTPAAAPIVPKV